MEQRYAVAVLVVIVAVGTAVYLSNSFETAVQTSTTTSTGLTTTTLASTHASSYLGRPVYGKSTIYMPAVDENGKGVVTSLKVESAEGEGRTLVNINDILFWTDTQFSIQTAKAVAENYTGYDVSKADIIYAINTSANLIEGPSAGAALTIATVAALRNQTLNPDVMITGTIEPDGTIGQVGGILEKAEAAKAVGAKLFLVPEGQAIESYYKQERSCRPIGPITYCTTNYVPVSIDISSQAGIQVKEVADISDALKYFLG